MTDCYNPLCSTKQITELFVAKKCYVVFLENVAVCYAQQVVNILLG